MLVGQSLCGQHDIDVGSEVDLPESRYPIGSPPTFVRLAILCCQNPLSSPPRAERILVIRLGALGDVVRTLPALHSLRLHYGDAHITWLVEPKAAEILRGQPDLNEVLLFPREDLVQAWRDHRVPGFLGKLSSFVSDLRRRRFDLVVDFHSILKSGLLARASGAPLRATYARPYGRELGWCFANLRARLEPPRASRYQRNAALVEFLGIDVEPVMAPPALDPVAVSRMAEQVSGSSAPDSSPACVVLIHPGSSLAAAHKRYTTWGYAGLVRSLVDEDGAQCWVLAGRDAEEAQLAQRIIDASAGRAQLAPATPTLADLCALIAQVHLFIGSDSGPLHLASSLGTPVVQIVGPTDVVENQPSTATPWRQVRVPLPCSPCRRGCTEVLCMKLIPHEMVAEAARALLAEVASHGYGPEGRPPDASPPSSNRDAPADDGRVPLPTNQSPVL